MSSDPRVHKPRLPKAYTDQQLTFLKSNLPEFERRSQGSIRGDAKKFALERATEFIARFGLPEEFHGVEESESRFREQIYNWFKNTVGRTRRKLEGRPRSAKKVGEKASSNTQNDLTWNTDVAAPTIIPYTQGDSSTSPINPPQTIITPVQYGGLQPSSSVASSIPTAPPSHSHTPHTPHPHVVSVNINQSTLRDAFLQGVDPSTLASMIQSYVITNPSPIPLTPVVDALYDVISTESNSFNREPHPYLRRFLDASNYFPPSIIHADVSGPHAGPRALQMQIRKYSTWIPNSIPRPSAQRIQPQTSSSSSITDEMRRIATDRQRRKDHIQWAHIHAAALELGMLVYGESDNTWYAWRTFSELMAKDAVWETDEVEWVAGICVLRAVIRTAVVVDPRQRDEYDELLRAYERRWKEIKDEARQALVTEVLIATKDSLAQLSESLT